MTLPNVTLTIQDGGLGAAQASDSTNVVVIGTSNAGSAGTMSPFYTRKSDLIAALGYGKGIEAACLYIDAGVPVSFYKTPNTTPGSCGAVTHVGTGVSVATVAAQTPNDDAEVIIKIITGVATAGTGTAGIQYSLDGGISYSATQNLSTTTYAIPNLNVTVSFTAASLVAGDTYSFAATAPIWGTSDITTAFAVLAAHPQASWRMVHVVGPCAAASAAFVDAGVQALATAFHYVGAQAVVDSAGFAGASEATWMAALITDYATFTSVDGRVCVGAGPVRIASSITGFRQLRSMAWLGVRKAMTNTIHTDISNLDAPLAGITDITGFTVVYHDENVVQGLDAARFMTMRTITGRIGYFITNPNLMAPSGSDFTLLQYSLVMAVAADTARQFFLNQLNKPVRVNAAGHILEKDAMTLEAGCQSALRAALVSPGHASFTLTDVARDDNILSTKTLTVNVFVIPLGYTKFINVTIGFRNPALLLAA